MTFLWPQLLWLLLLLPLAVLAHRLVLRRKKRLALRYAGLSMIRDAMGGTSAWHRRLPPLLFLLALATLLVAVARPAAVVLVPSASDMVVLAMDVSGSMRATDLEPSRVAAAQAAARTFVEAQPAGTRIAVVSFAGTAALVQPPTHSREDIFAAIDRFQLQRGTAVGSGLVVSLATIFPDAGIDVRELEEQGRQPGQAKGVPLEGERGGGKSGDGPRTKSMKPFTPVPAGSYNAAAIILLTDGQTTAGPDPMSAAKLVAERGVRVYTVGVGTVKGEIIRTEGWAMRVGLDEQVLKSIAALTQGEYFRADSADELRKVYKTLNARLIFERKESEVTALFAAAAAVLAALAAGLSLLWFGRIL